MRKMGFEPTRAIAHMRLKHARLPFRHFRLITTFIRIIQSGGKYNLFVLFIENRIGGLQKSL